MVGWVCAFEGGEGESVGLVWCGRMLFPEPTRGASGVAATRVGVWTVSDASAGGQGMVVAVTIGGVGGGSAAEESP
jgi:hypothetical protein